MALSNLEQARYNMIEQQVRPWDVLDPRVLSAMQHVPREDFVADAYRQLAFSDTEIPLGHGQAMMKPNLEGRLLQALNLQGTERVLEIGTGSGYLTACLAQLADFVESVDIEADFVEQAGARLAAHGIHNVRLLVADAAETCGSGHYDAIAITGSMPLDPQAYREKLAIGGRLFVVVGGSPVMEAQLITRVGEAAWTTQSLFEIELPPLRNVAQAQTFTF